MASALIAATVVASPTVAQAQDSGRSDEPSTTEELLDSELQADEQLEPAETPPVRSTAVEDAEPPAS